MEKKMNDLYRKIAEIIDHMIPLEWDEFYFNGEMENGEGGVFFFFKPKNEDDYVYSLDIPNNYDINSDEYNLLENKLFEVTNDLKNVFLENGQESWFSVTMKLTSEGKLKIEYDYTNWGDSNFGPSDRLEYWESKYLNNIPEDESDRIKIDRMKELEKNNN
ncbi:GNAT family acetyltransferase [Paenibacillus faecis]|uniref:immunity protein YezG family protein n=1 Tax=Paenibacillus faecis TaxID=862114 RepID=UPI001B22C21B|nr:immunity protein YezG family protein [Paenibacillus faecis]GIO86790.1 GNAT family acetyltransferase [Paenibacillus faecis]